MNDKSFINMTQQEREDFEEDEKDKEDAEVTTGFKFFWGAVFVVAGFLYWSGTAMPFGLQYLTAHNDARLSEIASEYAKDRVAEVLKSHPAHGDIELVSVTLSPSMGFESVFSPRTSDMAIAYRKGNELREFEATYSYKLTGGSTVWIDMTEPEEIRIQNGDHERNGDIKLELYAQDIKATIDGAVEIIDSHARDQDEWEAVFSDPNLSESSDEGVSS